MAFQTDDLVIIGGGAAWICGTKTAALFGNLFRILVNSAKLEAPAFTGGYLADVWRAAPTH